MNITEPIFSIVLDVDWAPNFVIDATVNLLTSMDVRASWFITHACSAIERLKATGDRFELGIHPNFMEGSTQGSTPEDVISYCLEVVPDAASMRTHAYYQSSLLFELIGRTTKIQNDASIFMPLSHCLPSTRYWAGGRYINRFPVFWEDDNELKKPASNLTFEPCLVESPGLKIFAFHPVLLYLNSNSIESYNLLKRKIGDFNGLDSENIQPFINSASRGVRNFLQDLSKFIHQSGKFALIKELPDICGKEPSAL